MPRNKLFIITSLLVLASFLGGCSKSYDNNTAQTGSGNVVSQGENQCTIQNNPYNVQVGANPEIPFPMTSGININLKATATYYKKDPEDANKNKAMDPPITYYGVGYAYISQVKISEGKADCAENHVAQLSEDSCRNNGSYSPYTKIEVNYPNGSSGEAYVMRINYRGEKLDVDSVDATKVEGNRVFDVLFLENKQLTKNCTGGKGIIFDVLISESAKTDFTTPRLERTGGEATYINSNGEKVKLEEGMSIKQILEYCGDNVSAVIEPMKPEKIVLGPGTPDPTQTTVETGLPSTIPSEQFPEAIKSFFPVDKVKSLTSLGEQTGEPPAHDPTNNNFTYQTIDLNQIKSISGLEQVTEAKVLLSSGDGTSLYVKKGDKWYAYAPKHVTATFTTECQKSEDSKEVEVCKTNVDIQQDLVDPPWCGFTPESKPAIYLYPPRTSAVNVKIGPSDGIRTTTIPPYDSQNGWNVVAQRNGDITYDNQTYSHLFYEALTPFPQMPKDGWVVAGNNLEKEIYRIGRQSRLNQKEAQEFSSYWAQKLPPSNYYFVGWINKSEIEKLEPLEINPRPDTLWRVRYYFIALQKPIEVNKPKIPWLWRRGFTAVEWGGYYR